MHTHTHTGSLHTLRNAPRTCVIACCMVYDCFTIHRPQSSCFQCVLSFSAVAVKCKRATLSRILRAKNDIVWINICFMSCRGIRYRLDLMCEGTWTWSALGSASLCLIPADHVPLVVLLSPCPLLCVLLGVNHSCFFSTVCCPAVRIHNHTVLPSSHNSSYVYTNDSAYTNISATVGEHSVPLRLLLPLLSPQFEPSVSLEASYQYTRLLVVVLMLH